MQRGSVDILKQLRQARSRLDKCIKFMVANERREKRLGEKTAAAFNQRQQEMICADIQSTNPNQPENFEAELQRLNKQT